MAFAQTVGLDRKHAQHQQWFSSRSRPYHHPGTQMSKGSIVQELDYLYLNTRDSRSLSHSLSAANTTTIWSIHYWSQADSSDGHSYIPRLTSHKQYLTCVQYICILRNDKSRPWQHILFSTVLLPPPKCFPRSAKLYRLWCIMTITLTQA